MTRFWNAWKVGLEAELRRNRPEPRVELVRSVRARIDEPRGARAGTLRLGFAGALTAGMLVALSSVGGLGYAATAAKHAVGAAHGVFTPKATRGYAVVSGITAGHDQYRPGYGFGDKDHNHTGPPGGGRKGGAFAPPLTAVRTPDGLAATVSTSLTLDEQAHLDFMVVDPDGTPLLLTQHSRRGGSTVGTGLAGPQTKVIQYAVLVPRTMQLKLRIPVNLLQPGKLYRIVIFATDPDGNRTIFRIPFRLG